MLAMFGLGLFVASAILGFHDQARLTASVVLLIGVLLVAVGGAR